jgi:glycine cleavage system transcriptional repressor
MKLAAGPHPGDATASETVKRGTSFCVGTPDQCIKFFESYEAIGVEEVFLLSAIGRDKPGLVAELAQLIYDADANLEDSRMTILGTDFAVILLCSSARAESADEIAVGAKHLERDHGLTILLRNLDDGPRPSLPSPGTKLYTLKAAGEDRAGIVVSICRALADHGVNIADLATRSRPGPGGSPHYELDMHVEVPESMDVNTLRDALDAEADRLVIDVALGPA